MGPHERGAINGNTMGGSQRILTNLSWSAGEQIVRLGLGFIVSLTLARYLGPEQFGTYSFLQSTVAMTSTLLPLAADQIVQRRLITQPDCAASTVGAAFALRIAGFVLASLAACLIVGFVKSENPYAFAFSAIAVIALACQSFDLIVVWFASQLKMRDIFWARTPPFFLISGVRGLMVANAVSFYTIVWTIAADAAVTALGLLVAFKSFKKLSPFVRFSLAEAKALLFESWPVFASLVMAGIYYRLDALMISWLVGDAELGIYGVAAKISELWNFLPAVVLGTITPLLIKARSDAVANYTAMLGQTYAGMGIAGLVISLIMSLFSTPICILLFGSQYQASGAVLAIHAWSTVPVFLVLVSNCSLIIEGRTKIVMLRMLAGLAANFTLNAVLIPKFGAVGAAMANVLAYSVAAVSLLAFRGSRGHVAFAVHSFAPASLRHLAQTSLQYLRRRW